MYSLDLPVTHYTSSKITGMRGAKAGGSPPRQSPPCVRINLSCPIKLFFFNCTINTYLLSVVNVVLCVFFLNNITKWKNVSCEIEDFVETHLCKLCGILRSRVLRVLCDLIKMLVLTEENKKSGSCGTQWVYKYEECSYGYVCDLFILVGRNIINRSMRRGNKCITRWK